MFLNKMSSEGVSKGAESSLFQTEEACCDDALVLEINHGNRHNDPKRQVEQDRHAPTNYVARHAKTQQHHPFESIHRGETFTIHEDCVEKQPTSKNEDGTPSSLPGAIAVFDSNGINAKNERKGGGGKASSSSASAGDSRWMLFGRRKTKRSPTVCSDVDDDVSVAVMGDHEPDASVVASATVPPVFRSIDILPPSIVNTHSGCQLPNDEFVDESVSVVTEVTEHSAATSRIRNTTNRFNRRVGSRSDITTSSMVTAEVVNSLSANNHPLLLQQEGGANCDARRSTRLDGNMDIPQVRTGMKRNESFLETTKFDGRVCGNCMSERTHIKETYGPFGVLCRMRPRTIEGRVYKGFCLRCHDVYDLRQLLHDPEIPLNLARDDPSIDPSIQRMQQMPETSDGFPLSIRSPKRSPMSLLCASFQFQVACVILLVTIVGACVGIGVSLSRDPEPWVAPLPTAAPSFSPSTHFPTLSPTSFQWNLDSVISEVDIESFGYSVKISGEGDILAVTSPKYKGNRGRLDVFHSVDAGWEAIGEPIVGKLVGDKLGFSMDLSDNGKVVAVGVPGNNTGMVKVYNVNLDAGLLQKGQSIVGPAPLSQFGYSVSLSYNASRLFIGAPQFGWDSSEILGLVQAYDFGSAVWTQVGMNIVGETSGSRFGSSVSTDHFGNKVAVGAPLDSEREVEAGRIFFFQWADLDWKESGALFGSQAGSQLGNRVKMHCLSNVVASGSHDLELETFPGAGIIRAWGFQYSSSEVVNTFFNLGSPMLGTYERANFGHDLDFDCEDFLMMIASAENQNERAGLARIVGIGDCDGLNECMQGSGAETAFLGPLLGDNAWLSKGPSVAMSGRGTRVAVGYESIRSNGQSRAEVRIYAFTST